MTGIADYAFRYSGLTGITLPESVRSIGENAFYECEALQSVTLNEGIEKIGDSAFFRLYKARRNTPAGKPDQNRRKRF